MDSADTATMRAYLDHNATSPLLPEALEAMLPYLREGAANPSSAHTDGQRARLAVEEAREWVAALAGSAPSEVVFTSGGTESNNAAIAGAATASLPGGRGDFPAGAAMVSTTLEHPAVHRALRALESRGLAVSRLEPSPAGVVDAGEVLALARPGTLLVSVMHVNNELGTVQPVEEIAAGCAERGILFHSDAVQSFGKLTLPEAAPLLSVSAHKLGGPQGVGALIVRRGARLEPLLRGGPQEMRRRPGTENVAGIAGFGAAARLALARREEFPARTAALRDRLEQAIASRFPGAIIHGLGALRVSSTSCFSLRGADGTSLQVALDLAGFSVSTGTACSSGKTAPSYVLRALGLPEEVTRAALRVSFGWSNTTEEVDRLVEALVGAAIEARIPVEGSPGLTAARAGRPRGRTGRGGREDRRGHERRRRFERRRGDPRRRGTRADRRVASDVRSRARPGVRPVLLAGGFSRRPPRGRAPGDSLLRLRRGGGVRAERHRQVRRGLPAGPHAEPLRAVQQRGEVRHAAAQGCGARRGARRDGTLRAPRRRTAPAPCCSGRSIGRRTSPTSCSGWTRSSWGAPSSRWET